MAVRRTEVEPERDERRVALEVTGELDLESAALLESQVQLALAQGVARIDVDLSAVSFLDSYGIRALVATRRATRERGARLSVLRPSPVVQRLLALTGLADFFSVDEPSS